MDYWPRTYVINLRSRTDRRRETEHELYWSDWPTPVEWFSAIAPRRAGGFPSPAVRGCFLSHLEVLRDARDEGLPRVIVLEDDVAFRDIVTDRLAEVERRDGEDWGLCYLGHRLALGEPGVHSCSPSLGIETLHAYAVSQWVYDELIEFLEALLGRVPGHPDGGPMFPDAAFSWFRRVHEVKTLAVVPSLAYQRSSRSDLSPRWFDRVPVLRSVADTARRFAR